MTAKEGWGKPWPRTEKKRGMKKEGKAWGEKVGIHGNVEKK